MSNIAIHDDRLPEVRDLLDALVTKRLHKYTNIYVGPDNNLVLQVDDSVLYVIPLSTAPYYGELIAFKYATLIKEKVDDSEDTENEESTTVEEEDVELTDDRSIYYGTDQQLLINMQSMYVYFTNCKNSFKLVAKDNDLRTNEQFEELLKLKTDQGLKYFKLNGEKPNEVFLIPMFAGFLSLSKPDKIGINVYDTNDGFLLVEFTIFKKKINRSISLYCRIIRL